MSKIIALKLVSGEEILASDESTPSLTSPSSSIQISKPRVVSLVTNPNGSLGVSMYPWMVTAGDSTFEVSNNAIVVRVSETQIAKSLLDTYIKDTTRIQLASAGSIAGTK